jgi:1-deoxy-D-xylulose-5-phosphate synthase
MWDLAILQVVPGIRIAAPRDGQTLREELNEAVDYQLGPTVVRFPKGATGSDIVAVRRTGDGVDVLREGASKDVLLVAVGSMASTALKVAELLEAQGIGCTVLDPRWVVPVAKSVLDLSERHRLVVTIEDGVKVGGVGTRVRQDLRAAQIDTAVTELGLPDEFLEHASRSEILERVGLTPQAIARDIVAQVVGARVPHAKPLDEITLDSRSKQSN